MTGVLLRTTLATALAYLGGLLGAALGRMDAHRLRLLVYAAMGVLLAVTVCDVLPDAKAGLSWPAFLVSVVSGLGLFWALGKYVAPVCPSCAFDDFDAGLAQRLGQTAALLMAALALHSTMDGVAIAVAGRMAGHASLGVLLGISLHKLPEGLALVLLLLGAGYSRRAALGWTFAIEAATEAGGLIGLLALRPVSPWALHLVFGHVGGGFVYLVLSTLGVFRGRHAGAIAVRLRPSPLFISSGIAFTLTALLLWGFGR